ncbi:hypothetical protein LS482_19480 [Sinomicrobium kalidii]|uniref:hypothetical protein n=1 Tax=Sinomicrobium kalidii TaxID=2900738 RepID=UPI001E2DBA27|nr:hypothetical protein [Sinomicrobium kalidii]UGU15848.1 hypothetical protein LS482_19480 [Sinomicrobium kalidii]
MKSVKLFYLITSLSFSAVVFFSSYKIYNKKKDFDFTPNNILTLIEKGEADEMGSAGFTTNKALVLIEKGEADEMGSAG